MNRQIAPLVFLFILTGTVHAEVFSCKDKSGKLYTSDQLIPECADQPVQVYKNSGMLEQEIPAPMTPQQRREAEIAAEQQQKSSEKKEAQKKEDHYLRVHFSRQEEIDDRRKEELDIIKLRVLEEAQIATIATKALQTVKVDQLRLSNKSGKSAEIQLENLNNKADDLEERIQSASQAIIDYHNQEIGTNQKFDRYILRFRELTNQDKRH